MRSKIAGAFLVAVLGVLLGAAAFPADAVAAESDKAVKLPPPKTDGGLALNRALAVRRSNRSLDQKPIALETLSQLLWAAQGIADEKGHRTAPSARPVYALEVYVLAGNVTGLAAGTYKFMPAGHELRLLSAGDRREEMVKQAIGQAWIKAAPAVVVITGVKERMSAKGGEKAVKWVYVEAGLAAENFLLEVAALGLASTYVGGFDTEGLHKFLGLPAGEEPIAVLPVGVPK